MSPAIPRRIPEVLRYGAVSGSCLVMHNAIMILADHVGLPFLAGIGLSFALVNTAGYLLHCRFTFDASPDWAGYSRFLAAMAVNTPLATLVLWVLAHPLGWPMTWAAPAASCGMIVVNFLASRLAIRGFSPIQGRAA